jgi:hypothetical protein
MGGRSVSTTEGDDIARLIALWDSPDYNTGGPVPPKQETDPEDAGMWAIWGGGPMVAAHRASAARCDRWWRENGKTESDKESRS